MVVPPSALRAIAHKEFDRLWLEGPYPLNRSDAYEWLAEKLEIPINDCHFSKFDRNMLLKVLEIMEIRDSDIIKFGLGGVK